MAIYVDQKIDDKRSAAIKSSLTWHDNLPNLAVSSFDDEKGSVVSIYDDNGTVVNSNVISRFGGIPPQVTCIQWHPVKKILFIGYESGDLSIWNPQLQENEFAAAKHNCALSVICSDNGDFLVTGDAAGSCVGWKCDVTGACSAVFMQNLKEAVTDVAFRTCLKISSGEELGRLAQVAKGSDEKALNLLSNWNHDTHEIYKVDLFLNEDISKFFVGCLNGVVYYFNENGHFEIVLQMEASIISLLYYNNRDILIIVTESLVLAQYHISENGSLTETSKIKLSGRKADINVQWAGDGVVSVCTGERVIYLWNVNTGHNDNLTLDDCSNVDITDIVTCIAFHEKKNTMSVGTNYGHIISWRRTYKLSESYEDETWQIDQVVKFQGCIRFLQWSKYVDILGALTATDIYLIREKPLCFMFKDHISAVQLSARQITLESLQAEVTVHLLTEATIKAVYLSSNIVALSTEKQLSIYEVNFSARQTHHVGTFSIDTDMIGLNEQSIYLVNGSLIEIRSFQGTLKQTVSFIESEGKPVAIDVCNNFLVACTTKAIVKVWDVSKKDAKLHFGPKSLESTVLDRQISSIKCNYKGNRLSFTMKKKMRNDFLPDSILSIFDMDSSAIFQFDFHKGKASSSIENSDLPLDSPVHMHQSTEIEKLISSRYPASHYWIAEDDRLITCEAKLMPPPLKRMLEADYSYADDSKHKLMVISCYVVPEHGLLIQDHFYLGLNHSALLGIDVPYYYILKKLGPLSGGQLQASNSTHSQSRIDNYQSPLDKKVMRDFVGMETCDKMTKEALLMFSYYLTAGNLDEAFRSIRVIKSQSVWNNMARMCIKTKRLDVAKVCLGKMGHVRGSLALQSVEDIYDNDVKVAILAVHLGMLEDAENILINCKKYDLLNQLYQDSGCWEKALEVAEKHDRVHLRNTYYNYAEHFEFKDDVNNAIQMYEKAEVHTFEVPRMLFEKPRVLESYVRKTQNKDIYRWWAQYLESIDEMESALQYYELAEDYLSLVRLYCYCNNLDKAAEIANETGDRAACFHVGRQFENQENIKEAIHFFTRAKAFNNAIRICKEHDLEDQLMNLALMSGPEEMIDVATFYEKQNIQNDKAVMLYHKAGLITKSVELAFKTHEHNALLSIANDLPQHADNELLFRCAQLFLEIEKYDKAVDLLALASQQEEALRLCLDHNIIISEELAEKLTPSKDTNLNSRNEVLEKIGDCCAEQESYHLAAKKYTQAGKKVKAMKALLKSGDTEKIIFFATVSRQKEIYIMAANYLQTLNWRQDSNLMKNIIAFYTKAKCFHHLCSFYEACAQDEIDEYQNYDKALEALNEACKCLNKIDLHEINPDQITKHQKLLQFKAELIKQFIQIQSDYHNNPDASIKQCRDLLLRDNIDIAVRRGDIYGFIVEHFCRTQHYKMAYEIILEMKASLSETNLSYYVKKEFLDSISNALSIDSIDQKINGNNILHDDNDYHAIEDIVGDTIS